MNLFVFEVAIFLQCLLLVNSIKVRINNENGSDSLACLSGNKFDPSCRTLHFIAQQTSSSPYLRRGLEVSITSPQLVLQEVIEFIGVSSFTLQGLNPETVITCDNGSFGIQFNNSFGVKLQNFSVMSCGVHSSNSFPPSNFQALLILETLNVVIISVNVSKSVGYGLSLVNINGYVTITNCIFERNTYKKNYTGGSGGLMIAVNSVNGKNYTATYEDTALPVS